MVSTSLFSRALASCCEMKSHFGQNIEKMFLHLYKISIVVKIYLNWCISVLWEFHRKISSF